MSEFNANKILVIRFSSLGDVVLTTAVFPNLRRKWPAATIAVLTKAVFAPVYANNPAVDEVRIFDPKKQSLSQLADEIRRERYDLIVDLHGNLRSWLIRVLAGPRRAVTVNKRTLARRALVWFKRSAPSLRRSVRERVLECLERIDVPVVSEETQLFPMGVETALRAHGLDGAPFIAVAPGARHATKRWPAARFAEAARAVAGPEGTVVILGDKSDRAAADAVMRALPGPCLNLAGWTSLAELIAILSRASFLLTNDSGILHIGEALKVPLVAVFGPTARAFGFGPYRASSRTAEVALECRPCSLHGTERCPLGHHRCMNDLGSADVVAAARELIGTPAAKA